MYIPKRLISRRCCLLLCFWTEISPTKPRRNNLMNQFILLSAIGVLLGSPSAQGAVTLTADPSYPASPKVFTVDPESFTPGARGVTGTRQLRQTFQLSQSIDVDGIVLSLAGTGTDGGLVLSFYELADVNASSWSAGTLVNTITLTTAVNLPTSTARLGLTLSGVDVFTLPQRDTGTSGYGIEISNFDGVSNIGSLRHSNDGSDNYTDGKFYTETGLQSGSGERDIALALTGTVSTNSGTWYVAPNGNDANPGTIGSPFETITQAQSAASSGETVYLRGGTYTLDNSDISQFINPRDIVNYITKDGISYLAYSNEVPVFDFSAVQPVGRRVTAFYVTADNCVFEGFEVVGVQITIAGSHTQSECFLVRGGDNNRFERLSMHDGMGIGWYLTRGSNNQVINCDAYNNKGLDSSSHGNIDGFGAHTDRTGDDGNMFIGCRAWFNTDDGFDLINCDSPVIISNCWAMWNGYDTNFTSLGDGTGFKAGGYGIGGNSFPTPVPRHKVYSSLALGNRLRGFYANHHTGGLDWINNTAVGNAVNYNLLCNTNANAGGDVPGFDHYMKNNLGFDAISSEVTNLGSTNDNDVTYNYWTLPVTVASGDFESLDASLLTQPRQANGDLPLVAYARLTFGSDLIDAGLDVGFPFNDAAPDLGAFEFGPIHYPSIDSIAVLPGGSSQLTFSGLQGQDYEVRATTDLSLTPVTSWALLDLGTFGASSVIYADFAATNYPTRYYVIRVP